MATRQQYLSIMIAALLLSLPAAPSVAGAVDAGTELARSAVLTHSSALMGSLRFYAADIHEIADLAEPVEGDWRDDLELALPDVADELELAVAEEDRWDDLELDLPDPADERVRAVAEEDADAVDEYELALPDWGDDLEFAQARVPWVSNAESKDE